jgi:hypothetical protein
MNKKIFILIIVAVVLQGLGMLFKVMDKMYGETIPTIVYQQNHVFNKLVYNNNINGKKVSIYASYPDDIDKNISTVLILDFIEKSIIDNWKPYLKKDNEVVIALKINNDGSKEYKFLGNTGIYAAANAARTAVLAPKLIDDIIQKGDYVVLVYRFKVSTN